ncbi:hypothetical protein AVEN_161607-1 [Araneus ventricosus]|uniref:Uncharacterized protein n=1 Tax=Araneus ventricosus TaxID=182803 RepID=A0A4Y2FR80_ARAVE|nr:hypothetical protein AVEN_161607-1 [Araneus ventricosus]
MDEFIKDLSRNFFQKLVNHTNPAVLDQLNYTHNNGKYAFLYATTKWSTPLSLHNLSLLPCPAAPCSISPIAAFAFILPTHPPYLPDRFSHVSHLNYHW